MIQERINNGIKWRYEALREKIYRSVLPIRVGIMRRKKVINVTFLVNDLPTWKTERLYNAMLRHSRFNPIVGIPVAIEREGSHIEVEEYCKSKGYTYVILDSHKRIKPQTNADILFYLKPYQAEYHHEHKIEQNYDLIHMYVFYSFHGIIEPSMMNKPMYRVIYYDFYDNELAARDAAKYSAICGRNFCVTGLPIADELLEDKSLVQDQWKNKKERKRIIYAPHHSIGDNVAKACNYGTFLELGEKILAFAKKYQNEVFFAFKPHPLLRQRLAAVWNQEQIDTYFKEWEELENTQYENGVYMGLFKYSDAMIHDCSSFIAEYMSMNKPVLFLDKDPQMLEYLNESYREAQHVHYHAKTAEEVEDFIKMVIAGNDPIAEERNSYIENHMLPPHGKTACENIINAILNQEEYKDYKFKQ